MLPGSRFLTGVAVRRHISTMDAHDEHRQRIERLTPLATVVRRIEECVVPIAPCRAVAPFDDVLGVTLAADVVVPHPQPAAAVALIDGYAVLAEWTADAGSYAPTPLPNAAPISAGEALPADCDAVMPFEAVTWRDGIAEAAAEVMAGDGVLLPGADAGSGEVLRRAGERLRAADVAAMRALGIESVTIRRPRIRVVHAGAADTAVASAIFAWLRHAITANGGLTDDRQETAADRPQRPHGVVTGSAWARRTRARLCPPDSCHGGRHQEPNAFGPSAAESVPFAPDDPSSIIGSLSSILRPSVIRPPSPADAIVIIGGSGSGARDNAVHALAEAGTVEVHGVAISPGESLAFGFASCPVLLVPGRLDGAIAAWLLVGRHLLARLAGGSSGWPACEQPLTAKVASTVGLTELVLVRRVRDGVEPLAAKYLPLASLAQADGFIVVPAASEGFASGARVAVRPMP